MSWGAGSAGKRFQQLWGDSLAKSNGSARAHRTDLTEGGDHREARLPGSSSPQSSPSERPTMICLLCILVPGLTLSIQRAGPELLFLSTPVALVSSVPAILVADLELGL